MVTSHCKTCGHMFLQGNQSSRALCYDCEPLPEPPPPEKSEPVEIDYDYRWKRICPPLYARTDLERLTGKWVGEVLNWQYGSKGLLVVGGTGSGKTRSVWMLLKRILRDDSELKFIATDSTTFRSGMADAARNGVTEDWIARHTKSDLIFFDDLGQMKVTEAASEALLTIINKRGEFDMPCIFTSQYRGEQFKNQFERQPQGEAIRRRISEFCQIVEATGTPATVRNPVAN